MAGEPPEIDGIGDMGLQGSVQFLRSLLEVVPAIIVRLDENFTVTYINRVQPGFTTEEVVGTGAFDFLVEPSASITRSHYTEVMRTGDPTSFLLDGLGPHGAPAVYRSHVVRFTESNGRFGCCVVVMDVTAEAERERELRESRGKLLVAEEEFRQLLESSPAIILRVSSELLVTYINNVPSEAGLVQSSVVGSPVADFIDVQSREVALSVISRTLNTGEPGSYEAMPSETDSRRYHVQVASLPPDSENGAQVLLLARDITKQHRATLQRETMVAELDHRSKNVLAMTIAIAEQSLERASSLDGFRDVYVGRLRSLARAHEALAASSWNGVGIAELVKLVVVPLLGNACSLRLAPARYELSPKAVTPLALTLHELATNAVKHGALSESANEGSVEIATSARSSNTMRLSWLEAGIAESSGPDREGLGLVLIRGLVEHELRGYFEVSVQAGTRRCTLDLPVNRGEI